MGDPALRDDLRVRAQAALARRSFAFFNTYIDPFYKKARHLALLIQHLEALERGDIEKLAVFMPPRHGKTLTATERFPAWFLGRNPRAQIIIASYTSDLAESASRKARETLKLDRWPFTESKLTHYSTAVNEWRTTAGGILKASSVGGSLTGFGADLLIIDDPLKGRAEADSELQRRRLWDWYTDVARTRLMGGGRELLIQTRWHEDDLAGRLLATNDAKRWTIVEFPAIAICPICSSIAAEGEPEFCGHGDRDVLGRLPGEHLWPESRIEIPRPGINPITARSFASVYQQRPTPDEGTLFKRSWFDRRYAKLASLPQFKRAAIFVDGAWKDGIGNDRSAMALWATDNVDWYLVDAWAGRIEYPELKAKVRDYWNRWKTVAPTVFACVEDAASGIPLIMEFKRSTNIPIIGVKVDKSKYTRAEAVSPIFESGKAVLPLEAPWLDEWIEEHVQFPGAKHDDFVDTTSGALARLANLGASTWSFAVGRNS